MYVCMYVCVNSAQRNFAEGIVTKVRCPLDALAGIVLLPIPVSYIFCVIVTVDLTHTVFIKPG